MSASLPGSTARGSSEATTQATSPRGAARKLTLGAQEHVAFIGDSITQQHLYTALIETFLITRLPQARLRFTNLGWGGDVAPGGAARFARDVAPLHPTLVLVNFGMNDGSYAPPQEPVRARWLAGIQDLVARIRACAARPVLLTTSAVEESGGSHLRRYNETLGAFAATLRRYAEEEGIALLDLFTPCLAAVTAAQQQSPPLSLVPDGVHPDAAGHLVLAAAALAGMELPPGLGRVVATPTGIHAEGRVAVGPVAHQPDRIGCELHLPVQPWWIPPEARAALPLVAAFHAELNPFVLDASAFGEDASLSIQVDGTEVAVLPPGAPKVVDLTVLDAAPWAEHGRALWTQVQARFQLHLLAWRQLALADPPAVTAEPSHGRLLAAIAAYLEASAAALPRLVAPARVRLELVRSHEIGFTAVDISPIYPCVADTPGDFERRHPPETDPDHVPWRGARLERWHLDLFRHHGGGSHCVTYVRLRVDAATPAVIRWDLGSDDGISLLVNGERRLERNVYRACRLGDDQVETPVPAGPSTVLLRVTQGGGGWSVAVRARTIAGGPVVPVAG